MKGIYTKGICMCVYIGEILFVTIKNAKVNATEVTNKTNCFKICFDIQRFWELRLSLKHRNAFSRYLSK